MNTLIVYYSRTGTTGKLAKALAERLGADVRKIGCKRYRPGGLRYLRAGYDSLRGTLPDIEMPRDLDGNHDLVLIGTPIWTSHPAVPMCVFLRDFSVPPARLGLFLTYGGHSPPETAVTEVEDLLGRKVEAAVALKEDAMSDRQISDAVDAFVQELGSRAAA